MYFQNRDKGMVLNKTNARTIGDIYGDDTDEWRERIVEVFAMKVEFNGRMVDGLRVRVPPPPRQGSVNVAPNARARAMATAGAPDEPPPPVDDGYRGDPMDDEIPFAPEWR